MSDEYRRVRLWQVRATEKAYLFETLPPIMADSFGWYRDPKSREVWIPRSQIKHISRNPPLGPGGIQECLVDLSEWFADKEDL